MINSIPVEKFEDGLKIYSIVVEKYEDNMKIVVEKFDDKLEIADNFEERFIHPLSKNL